SSGASNGWSYDTFASRSLNHPCAPLPLPSMFTCVTIMVHIVVLLTLFTWLQATIWYLPIFCARILRYAQNPSTPMTYALALFRIPKPRFLACPSTGSGEPAARCSIIFCVRFSARSAEKRTQIKRKVLLPKVLLKEGEQLLPAIDRLLLSIIGPIVIE